MIVWTILSIVLVASLVFIVCALGYLVATRLLPSAGRKRREKQYDEAAAARTRVRTLIADGD